MDRSYIIEVDPQVYARLEEESRAEHRNVSEIANDVLRRHNFSLRVKQMREKLVPLAQKAGYNSDEDIFRDVS